MHTVVWCETVKVKDHLKTLAQTGQHGVDSSACHPLQPVVNATLNLQSPQNAGCGGQLINKIDSAPCSQLIYIFICNGCLGKQAEILIAINAVAHSSLSEHLQVPMCQTYNNLP